MTPRYSDHEIAEYHHFIDNLLLTSIYQGKRHFSDILLSLPGVYPSAVLESLEKLFLAGKISEKLHLEINESASKRPSRKRNSVYENQRNDIFTELPVPHPLDYEWRFGKNAIDSLLKLVLELTEPEDAIVLFGVPSVFWAAKQIGYPRRLILFEANKSLIHFFGRDNLPNGDVISCNLMIDDLPEIASKLIIIDPPWYPECYKSFLWAAAQICRQGGFILLSTPPIGTRPNIEREWRQIVNWAISLGFNPIEEHSGILPYVSPPFERNALKAEGIYNVPKEWRHGNLNVFVHKYSRNIPRPILCMDEHEWMDESISGIRYKLRPQNNNGLFSDPRLKEIVPGDILPSVSRFDERRKYADVWTSGNRIFRCQNTWVAQMIIKAMAKGDEPVSEINTKLKQPLSQSSHKLINCTENQFKNIAVQERAEYMVVKDNF